MPKQRQTCTRCSQRRQKCDRRSPCTRCVQNKEAHLCTTQWKEGYNPAVHRQYPKKPSVTVRSVASSNSSSSDPFPDALSSASNNVPTAPAQGQSQANLLPERFKIGESRVLDISIGSLLNEKDEPTPHPTIFDQGVNFVKSHGTVRNEPWRSPSCFSPAAKTAEVQYLQSLLPDRDELLTIIDYYYECMLYWIGGLYHGPTFRQQVLRRFGASSTMDLNDVDWRWMALMFAIMSSALIASPETLSASWGYPIDDKIRISRAWGGAAVTCLTLGNYTSQYHVYSVQAISVLHAYEHLVGSSNQWAVLQSAALVIAKGLGLHRLGPHPDNQRIAELREDEKEAFIEKEMSRRTWNKLAVQEWLCCVSQNQCTVNIQKRYFINGQLKNLDDETMLPIADGKPCFALVSSYFYEYANTLLDFRNTIVAAENADESSRYAMVVKFDGEFRQKCADALPDCLNIKIPLDPSWPKWVKWARNLHEASVNHKIIMLHQSFLSKGFRNVRYAYTRWAISTSSKNIINLYGLRDPEEPQYWVEQAFVVTSAICLALDMFHRLATDAEATEYYEYVQKAIRWLQQFPTSSVTVHGVRLLSSLLQEYNKLHEGTRSQMAPTTSASVQVHDLNELPLPQHMERPWLNDDTAQFTFDIDNFAFEDLMEFLPAEGGLDANMFFGSISGLANGPAE